ncbi:MAG: WD40 repeat domain-containing protein [Pirellulales bacterium]
MFDPYRKWLGIPEGTRPPTHYQLLAISPDESDREVINAAAVRQSSYVRNFQAGKFAEDATKILNELAAAKACLLDAAKRAAYDAQLQQSQPAAVSRPASPAPKPAAARPAAPTPAAKPKKQLPPAEPEIAPWDLPLPPGTPDPLAAGLPLAGWDTAPAEYVPQPLDFSSQQPLYHQPLALQYAPAVPAQPATAFVPLATADDEWWRRVPRWVWGTGSGFVLLSLIGLIVWANLPEPPVRPPDYSQDGGGSTLADKPKRPAATADRPGTSPATPANDDDGAPAVSLTPPGEFQSGERLRAYGAADKGAIRWLRFSSDGQYLLSCCALSDSEGSMRLWTVAAGGEYFLSGSSEYPRHNRPITAAAFLDSPFDLVGLEGESFARFYRFSGRKLADTTEYVQRNNRFGNATCAALSQDGTIAAWGNKSMLAVSQCRRDGPTWLLPVGSPIKVLAIHPRGEYVCAALGDRTVHTWTSAQTGRDAFKPWQTDAAVNDLAYATRGDRLAAVCEDGALCMWQAGYREEIFEKLVSKRKLASLAFSSDDNRLIVGDKLGFVQILLSRDGEQIRQFQAETSGAITAVALSPDGKQAATGSQSGAVRIWELKDER